MIQAKTIREAYLKAHNGETFSINLTGNIRLIIDSLRTSNTDLFSGKPIKVIGGADAYWKFEEGYFFIYGSETEIKYLYEQLVKHYELRGYKQDGAEVVTLRERATTEEEKPGRPSLASYLSNTNCASKLTPFDKRVLEMDYER